MDRVLKFQEGKGVTTPPCLKNQCGRLIDNEPRWRLSLSRLIQSDYLWIAVYDGITFGAGTLTWQDPVHSWKAGPGEVMTVENKQTKRTSDYIKTGATVQRVQSSSN